MKRFVALLIPIFLTGCYSDQRQHLAACELRAKRETRSIENTDIQKKELADYIELCMQAAGYELISDGCQSRFQTPNIDILRKMAEANGADPKNKDPYNIAIGRIVIEYEQLRTADPVCYKPMGWSAQQVFKFERFLGRITPN